MLLQAGVGTVLLYGSVARGDATEHSDIDLIAIYDNIDYDQRRKMASQLARSSQRRLPGQDSLQQPGTFGARGLLLPSGLDPEHADLQPRNAHEYRSTYTRSGS